MISIDQFKEAQKIIADYEQQFREAFVGSHICICCKKKKIEPFYGTPPILQQEDGTWKGGTVALISFGFGSIRDMERYYIAICDDCIDIATRNGTATNYDRLADICHKNGLPRIPQK